MIALRQSNKLSISCPLANFGARILLAILLLTTLNLGGCSEGDHKDTVNVGSEKSTGSIALSPAILAENLPLTQYRGFIGIDRVDCDCDANLCKPMDIDVETKRAALTITGLLVGNTHTFTIEFCYQPLDSTTSVPLATATSAPKTLIKGINNLEFEKTRYKLFDTDDDGISSVNELKLGLDPSNSNPWPSRSRQGLVSLYNFKEGSGVDVRDVSGVGTPLDLVIQASVGLPGSAVAWLPDGGLSITAGADPSSPGSLISSGVAATKVIQAVKAMNEMTIEFWGKPDNTEQSGPARLVTISEDGLNRNMTIGQERDFYNGRVRSTTTDDNARKYLDTETPSDIKTPSGTATANLSHVVMTRDTVGTVRLYVNSQIMEGMLENGGDLSNWNNDYQLGLANEISRDRPWLGEIHRVALYRTALNATEILQNYVAGAKTVTDPVFSPEGADYTDTVNVNITATEPGTDIYYRVDYLNGPFDSNEYPYNGPIPITRSAQITAWGTKVGLGSSNKVSAQFINTSEALSRTREGLLSLYTFKDGEGNIVKDVSGAGLPLDLTIQNIANVNWIPSGGLSILEGVDPENPGALISSGTAAKKIIDAARETNEITVEFWATPADTEQGGPARVVTISEDASNRNMTVGQDTNFYEGRFRSSLTNNNASRMIETETLTGIKTLHGTVAANLSHVVMTRDTAGTVRIYINSVLSGERFIGGDLSNWDNSYQLGLANELTNNRKWLGDLYLVALYSRALNATEILQNYIVGSMAESTQVN